MSHRLLLPLLASMLCVLLAAPAAAFKRTKVGEDLKEFRLETPAGDSVGLTDSQGERATLVVFWATWNPRSTQLLGDLQELYAEHREHGFEVLAINAENAEWNPATREKVAETIQDYGLTYPVVIDPDLAVYNEYGVVALPSVLLADGRGRIAALQEGYPTAARLELRDQLRTALGLMEPPPSDEVAVHKEQLTDPKVRRKVEMGRLLLQRRRPSRAVKVLEEAIRADPTYAEGYRVLAEVLDALDRGADAESARAKLAELEKPVATAATREAGGSPAQGVANDAPPPVTTPPQ